MTRPTTRRRASRIAVASLALAAMTGSIAMPAHAAIPLYDAAADNSGFAYHLNPANEVNGGQYVTTWTPASREGFVQGTDALIWGPNIVDINTGCPEGYRAASRSFMVTAAGLEKSASVIRDNPDYNGWGLNGQPIRAFNDRAALWTNLTATTFPTGVNAFVMTCDPQYELAGGAPDNDMPIGNAKYFVAWVKVDRAAHKWELTTDPRSTKADTQTSVASSDVTATSVTLKATVNKADVTGKVTFTSGSISKEVDVVNGVATTSVTGLTPNTAYTFSAAYGGNSAYNASTGSATFTTAALPANQTAAPGLTVSVPTAQTAQPTGLKLTVAKSSVELANSAARVAGQEWVATGALGDVTVNDDRQIASTATNDWNLNGSASVLTSGSTTIQASELGWTPSKTEGPSDSIVGTPATSLVSPVKLASGKASATANVTTKVTAGLSLKVPSSAAAGNYTGTLTLTLI